MTAEAKKVRNNFSCVADGADVRADGDGGWDGSSRLAEGIF